jgi:16S rRNA (guanine(1405)-N(7))-methyltransferase
MSEHQDKEKVDQIVSGVLAARKYRDVCTDTVRRFAAEEWAKHRNGGTRRAIKEASKATRSRLHQVYGAYESRVDYARAYRDLASVYAAGRPEAIETACRRLLALHSSTRERLPILDHLYDEVFSHTGVPNILLDLACGLNPLSLPWMGLEEGAAYYAYDIDRERIDFLNRYFALAGVSGCALLQDVLSQPPVQQGDVALLFKSSPCLEHQQKGATLGLLDALRARYVVVTFPVHSLSRRNRGMPEHYERSFQNVVSGRPWLVSKLRFETELVFLVDKG